MNFQEYLDKNHNVWKDRPSLIKLFKEWKVINGV